MALVKGAGPTARALYDYLQQPAARAVFERYGFMKPSEP
jgi:molybdate transport system substrate-binding protein